VSMTSVCAPLARLCCWSWALSDVLFIYSLAGLGAWLNRQPVASGPT
jgi:hypothetical protein